MDSSIEEELASRQSSYLQLFGVFYSHTKRKSFPWLFRFLWQFSFKKFPVAAAEAKNLIRSD